EAVLREEAQSPDTDRARPVAQSNCKRIAVPGDEIVHGSSNYYWFFCYGISNSCVGKGKCAVVEGEIVVIEAAELAAEPERVGAAKIAQGVGEYGGCVSSSLRESGGTANVEIKAGDADLRQPDRGSDAVVDEEVGRVERRIRRKRDANTV